MPTRQQSHVERERERERERDYQNRNQADPTIELLVKRCVTVKIYFSAKKSHTQQKKKSR